MKLAKRIDRIQPSATLAMTSKAAELRAQGKDVLNMSVGEPDFNTPSNIISAAIDAMNNGHTRYTPGGGTKELKQAIQKKLQRDNNIHYELNEIIYPLVESIHFTMHAKPFLLHIGYPFQILYQLLELHLFLLKPMPKISINQFLMI